MRKAIVVASCLALAFALGCSNVQQGDEPDAVQADASPQTEDAAAETVFGSPDLKISRSGSGEALGTVAVFYAPQDECTHENLDLWYEQYVKDSVDDWCIVKYEERPYFGVYALGDMMEIGVRFDSDNMLADDSEAEMYFAGSGE